MIYQLPLSDHPVEHVCSILKGIGKVAQGARVLGCNESLSRTYYLRFYLQIYSNNHISSWRGTLEFLGESGSSMLLSATAMSGSDPYLLRNHLKEEYEAQYNGGTSMEHPKSQF